ncbi:MAG: hypothetical protein SH817_08515 [Leptospira sp.]|nr:hypothetical protein [Leptospira sp.]
MLANDLQSPDNLSGDSLEDIHYQLKLIKLMLLSGEIDYERAKEKAKPYIEILNAKANIIARKYGKQFYPISFLGFMR